jgi:hypothetical protein
MRVLFLAYGATRRRTVVDEAADVVAGGGRAVVLIEWPALWRGVEFAPGVEVVNVYGDRWTLSRTVVDWVLFRFPEFVLGHLARGPFARTVARFGRGYRNRIARPLLDGVVLPAHRWLGRAARERVYRRHLFGGERPDLVVIGDPVSMPEALAVLARYGDGLAPQLSYRMDLTVRRVVMGG